MKKLSTLSSLFFPMLLLYLNVPAQPNTDWVARYNGPGNKSDVAREIVLDAQGNIYVTGTSQNKNGSSCIATVKYNNAGVQQWAARYTGTASGDNYPYGLVTDGDGNVYVTGRSTGSGNATDIVTIRYNSMGAQQWATRYNGSGNLNDVPGDLKVDAAGKVFVTGAANSPHVAGVSPTIVTIAYNADGTEDWVRLYDQLPNDGNGANKEEAISLALDGDGNVYVTGSSAGMVTIKYDGDGQPQWARTITNANGRKVLIDASNNVLVSGFGGKIGKYDPEGNLIWQANASLSATSFWDMKLDGGGNVYVTGTYDGISNNHSDYVTAKYSFDGAEQWIKTYNGSSSYIEIARSIALDGSGNVYVTGYTSVNNGTRNGGINYGTIKYNNNGVQEWLALYDSPDKNGSHAFGIVTDADGNVYVTGQSATKATSFDYATIKYSQGSSSKSVTTAPLPETADIFHLRNYPNPFSNNTTIEYYLPQEGKVKLDVYDLLGQQVATLVNETKVAGTHLVNLSANKLSRGTYWYRIRFKEFVETRKLIIVK